MALARSEAFKYFITRVSDYTSYDAVLSSVEGMRGIETCPGDMGG